MKRIFIMMALGLALVSSAKAQEEDKLVVKPSGRILMDAGLFDANNYNEKFNDGMAIPDMRVGFKAKYGQWSGKVDIGYAYGNVSMKDVFMENNLGKHDLIRVGYFVHQFGLQSATSSSFKISMEEPQSNQAFFNSRLLGAMYVHSKDQFFGTLSFFEETEAMKRNSNQLGNNGVGMMSRLVYRPWREPGKIFHIGISGAFETPRYNSNAELNHHSFVLSSNFPTRIASVAAQSATISDAKVMYKFTPEMNVAIGRLAIETQYYYAQVNRNNGQKNYKASGAYGLLRGLVKGTNYKYTDSDCGIATPDPGSMEVVLAYNYTDLSDHNAEILGGRLSDWSATFNYYLNKYMIWRVRCSLTKTTDRADYLNTKLTILETRLQIKF